jgi:hypothetical protein
MEIDLVLCPYYSRFFYDLTNEQFYGDKLKKLLAAVKKVFGSLKESEDSVDGPPVKAIQPVKEEVIQPMVVSYLDLYYDLDL